MKKQLIVISDMEGASGIFEANRQEMIHGSEAWQTYGRAKMTSDVLAVCEAANACGVDEIFCYDAHFAGNPEHNVLVEQLPSNVIVPDVLDRCFYWRRIRGQAENFPIGVITVGQHARYGEPDAYFPHTIQSPPISELRLNGIHIAEIGMGVLSFWGTPYVANIGCAASEKEAKELSPAVTHITVKSKAQGWEPSAEETHAIIRNGVMEALSALDQKQAPTFEPPYIFEMRLTDGYRFDTQKTISWKGIVEADYAQWEAPGVEMGLELFNDVRSLIEKKG